MKLRTFDPREGGGELSIERSISEFRKRGGGIHVFCEK